MVMTKSNTRGFEKIKDVFSERREKPPRFFVFPIGVFFSLNFEPEKEKTARSPGPCTILLSVTAKQRKRHAPPLRLFEELSDSSLLSAPHSAKIDAQRQQRQRNPRQKEETSSAFFSFSFVFWFVSS